MAGAMLFPGGGDGDTAMRSSPIRVPAYITPEGPYPSSSAVALATCPHCLELVVCDTDGAGHHIDLEAGTGPRIPHICRV